uniref:Uncharacterized protein n=1 Tax=Rhizophora mucronata TaxID=61149 RepID=A0A2P2MXL1_RHIMU
MEALKKKYVMAGKGISKACFLKILGPNKSKQDFKEAILYMFWVCFFVLV